MIKFIHAADLHLDTPFSGLEQTSKELAEKLRQAPYESLAKIVDLAIEEAVDFVLFAGDLYNTKRVNIKAQSLFIEQLDRLNQAQINVFLIRGNHDYITETEQTLTLPFPENVYTYDAEVSTHQIETKHKKRVAISGFSYDSQWIFDRKISAYPTRAADVDFHIGLLHGSADGIQSTEANYAPFSMKELQEKQYDYWALGHIHQRQQLAPNIHYPGNTQGLHKNETGEKGCLLVEWDAHHLKTEFISTAPLIWQRETIDISDVKNIAELFELLRGEMSAYGRKEEVFVHLTIQSRMDSNEKIIQLIQELHFTQQLTEQLKLPNIWLVAVEFHLIEDGDTQSLKSRYPEMWEGATEQALSAQVFSEMTEGIFTQIPGKYLNESNNAAYRKKMIEKAIAKILLK